MLTLPAEYGYIGVILITSFTYTLLRLRFVLVVLITLVGIGIYLPYAYSAQYIVDVSRVLATLYLISFGALGCLAAYRTERFTRALFVRGRQLEEERQRSDVLLSNILPLAIIEQLKESAGGRIAQSLDEVSVVFIDAVGSTEQASNATAEDFAEALDDLFRTMDGLATRHGLEKIKTDGRRVPRRRGRAGRLDEHAGGGRRDGARHHVRDRDGPLAVGRTGHGCAAASRRARPSPG